MSEVQIPVHFPHSYNWSLMNNVTKGIILIKKINSFNISRKNKWVYCQGLNQPRHNIVTQEFLAPNPAAYPPGTQLPKVQQTSWLTSTELQTRCRPTAFTSTLNQTGTNWWHVRHGLLQLGCSIWDDMETSSTPTSRSILRETKNFRGYNYLWIQTQNKPISTFSFLWNHDQH